MSYLSHLDGFSPAERSALRLDGSLSLDGEFLDVADSPDSRAQRTLGKYADRLVLTGFSAAWTLGACAEPQRHVASYRHARSHVPDDAGFVIEQRHFSDNDLCGTLTTPLRTALDLLRSSHSDDQVFAAVTRLMNLHNVEPHHIHRVLERSHRLPYRHRALTRLRKLANLPAG